MNTIFVFRLKGEAIEGLATVAGQTKGEGDCTVPTSAGGFSNEHAFCVQLKR
ncbi:hypothetical protein [Alkalihalobacillus sp. R86527]|uniref:hypothetical protein n=1 Tax=Alkalihalobacillus sp. R86527 TaxID=3093863 RepID=UPI00366BC2AF